MKGGKTTRLLSILESAGRACKCLYVNSIIDERNDIYSTHNPLLSQSLFDRITATAMKVDKLRSINDDEYKKYEVICIDEGQFFPDLVDVVDHLVDNLGKEVYIAGLNSDFQRKSFGQLHLLLARADTIELLRNACCDDCRLEGKRVPAIFSYRLDQSLRQVVVGAENYMPLCRKCYLSRMSREMMNHSL